ncbi:MAG: hypothetical protein BV459_04415 [Thermoplasmata archaeon M11B2D]|nr:MAG: hypothetical protein BV459_04415 [Thermoplasmata archaeon M11B2D]
MRITDFKAQLKGGGARNSLFHVDMSFPGFAGNRSDDEKLHFTCKAASLPASTIPAIEVPYMGRKIKVAGNRTFEEWTITVINDTDFKVRNAFERWMDRINSHAGNVGLDWGRLTRDAAITQYDRSGKKIKKYLFKDIFPTTLGAIEMSWDSDTVEEFTVTLSFNYWTSDTTS